MRRAHLPSVLESDDDYVGREKHEVADVKEALSRGNTKLASSLVSEKLWTRSGCGVHRDIIDKTSRLIEYGPVVDRINYGFGRGPEDTAAIELLENKVLPYF